jgi:hypothetical protein
MLGTVDVRTRPLRFACLVDPKNETQVREAIRLSSTLWGGAFFPIVPLYKVRPASWGHKTLAGPSAKDVVLGYLEAFDPDILVQFSSAIPSYVADIGLRIVRPEEVWSSSDKDRGLYPQLGIGVFELLDDIFIKYFRFRSKYPIRIMIPTIPQEKELSLFWSSWLGDLAPNILSSLEKFYFERLEIEVADVGLDKIQDITAQNVFFPKRVTQHGLIHYSRSWSDAGACVYFIDGTNVEDIVDFWNLRATGRRVLPVPKQLRDESRLKELVETFLKENRRPRKYNPQRYEITSMRPGRSCTMDEVKQYVRALTIEREPGDLSSEPFCIYQDWYPAVWNEWSRNAEGEVPDDIYGAEEYSVDVREWGDIKLRALLPEFAEKHRYHGEPRCANEVSFSFFGADEYIAEVFPKSFGQNYIRAISGLTSFRDWRVGRNGLVKIVAEDFGEWRGIPTAEAVFFGWLLDKGWEQPQLSTPGVLAKQIHKRLLGNPLIALKTEKLLRLFEYMNGGKVRKNLSLIEEKSGRAKKHTEERLEVERDLKVGDVINRLKEFPESDNLHDYLLSRGVFKLGLSVKCPHCLRASWFELESLRDTLECPKCLNTFPAIGNVKAPDWSYRTAGPFSVPRYADGAYSVLLTLEALGGRRSISRRTTPVLSFRVLTPSKEHIEVDIAMFWQEEIFGRKSEGLLFGECKTYDRFKKEDFARMRYLAKTFRGAVLVFSTMRPKLSKSESRSIRGIAKAGRKHWKYDLPLNPVLVLTGTELLYRWSGPPHCWDELTQKRFGHVHGLLDLCNATQQLYLDLPPWQDEWREKKRSARPARKARKN